MEYAWGANESVSGGEFEELLHEGERIQRVAEFGTSRLAVTDHRLLALTPDVRGANFYRVDRPNVEDVSVGTESNLRYLSWIASAVILAIPFLAGSRLLSFDGMFSGVNYQEGGSAMGIDLSWLDTVATVFALVDDALLVAGVACLLLVVPFSLLYVRSRTTVVRVRVAGGDDVSIPVGNQPDVDVAVDAVREALGFAPRRSTGAGPAAAETVGQVDGDDEGSGEKYRPDRS